MRNFVYNENNQLIAEYDNNNNVIAEYYYFGLRSVAVKTNGVLHIVHTDYLGTPRVITNSTSGGSIVWEWKNDNPYGNNKAEGSIEFNLRFAGQYYDYESGLHYNINRNYNPETGRYMQSDPIGLAGGFNTYNYVNKNPLDGVDPLGWESVEYYLNRWISNAPNWYLALNLAKEEKMTPLRLPCGDIDKEDADNRTAAEHYIYIMGEMEENGLLAFFYRGLGPIMNNGYQGIKLPLSSILKTSKASLTQLTWENLAWWDSFNISRHYTPPAFAKDADNYIKIMNKDK